MLLYIFFIFTMIAALKVTPEVSILNFILQNDFWILTRVFKDRIAAERLNQGLTRYSTELSLIKLVGKRRSLLNYLAKVDIYRYRALIKELDIRK